MKRVMLLASALLIAAGPALAGSLGPLVGGWDTEDAGDDQGAGARLVVDLGPDWNFEVRGTWLDSLAVVSQGRVFELEAFPIDVGLSYGFDTAGRVEPFVGGGASFVSLDGDSAGLREAVRVDEEAGWYAVAGIDVALGGRIAFFGEALYRQVKASFAGNGFEFADFRADLAGVGGNVGLALTW